MRYTCSDLALERGVAHTHGWNECEKCEKCVKNQMLFSLLAWHTVTVRSLHLLIIIVFVGPVLTSYSFNVQVYSRKALSWKSESWTVHNNSVHWKQCALMFETCTSVNFFCPRVFFCNYTDAFLPPASSDLRRLAKWKPFRERQNESGYLKESVMNLANLAQLSAAPLGRSGCVF